MVFLIEVTQHLDDYMNIGLGLNLSREIIESISQEKKNNTERNITIRWTWKRRNSSSASFIELVKAFLKMKKWLVAESILKYLSKKTTLVPHQVACKLAPEMAKHRYPKWDEKLESEKETIRNNLMDKNYEASVDYSCFVIQLIHFLKSAILIHMKFKQLLIVLVV